MSDTDHDTFANQCASANIAMLKYFGSCVTKELIHRLRTLQRQSDEHNEQLRKDREAHQPVTREWWMERFGDYRIDVDIGCDLWIDEHGDVTLSFFDTVNGHGRDDEQYGPLRNPTRSDIETLVRLFGGAS